MKTNWLYVICLMILTSNVFAQTKVGETCETKLKNTELQLNKEKTARQIATDSIRVLKNTMREMDEQLQFAEKTLLEKEDSLEEAQKVIVQLIEKIQSKQDNESDGLKADCEKQLQAVQNEKKDMQIELLKSKQELNDAEKTNQVLKATISELQATFPFIVKDIKFKNVYKKGKKVNDYNEMLISSNMEWLTIKIYYSSLLEKEKEIDFIIKIYKPDGTLWYYSKKDMDFTANVANVSINQKEGTIVLNEWEKNAKSILPAGKFKAGKYRMEIWYKDVCLGKKNLEIL